MEKYYKTITLKINESETICKNTKYRIVVNDDHKSFLLIIPCHNEEIPTFKFGLIIHLENLKNKIDNKENYFLNDGLFIDNKNVKKLYNKLINLI